MFESTGELPRALRNYSVKRERRKFIQMTPNLPVSWKQLLVLNIVAKKMSSAFNRFVKQVVQKLKFRDDHDI